MYLIAFITEGMQIRKILDHIGVDSAPPCISLARGPPRASGELSEIPACGTWPSAEVRLLPGREFLRDDEVRARFRGRWRVTSRAADLQ